MLEGSIWDKVLKLAIPLALTSILQQCLNAGDVLIAGKYLSPDALAAVGANGIVINLSVNLFVGISIGANVICAQYLGANNLSGVSKTVHTSIIVGVVGGIILAIAGHFFAKPLLLYLDTPHDILDYATDYLRFFLIGAPFLILYNFLAALFRSKGDIWRPFYVMLVASLANYLLNNLFVAKWGFGIEGLAIATVLALTLAALTMLYFLYREEGALSFQPQNLHFDLAIFTKISKIGIPAGLQGMVFSISNIIIQIALNNLGSAVVAATTTALIYELITFFILSSFGQAATTLVGQNYGARNLDRCKAIAKWCLGLNFILTGLICIAGYILAEQFTRIFTTDALIIAYSVTRIQYVVSFQFINMFIENVSAIMRGYGYSLVPAIICVLGACVFRIIYVYTYYEANPTYETLLLVYPYSWLITAIPMVIVYLRLIKKIDKNGVLD